MNLIAFDTSSEYLSMAFWHRHQCHVLDELVGIQHSAKILPYLYRFLNSHKLKPSALDGVVVGVGPGSFTGVRIGIAVAKGLAFGLDVPVVGICGLLALAEASTGNRVISALDARMGEIYLAAYQKQNGSWDTVLEPMVCKPNALPNLEGSDWIGVGTAWQLYAEPLQARYAVQSIQTSLHPLASVMLRLALPILERGEGQAAALVKPLYVRQQVAMTTAERLNIAT